jgi:hypothetical protein
VVQARAEQLRAYPKGRSAMVFYAATEANESLAAWTAGRGAVLLAQAACTGATLVRFADTVDPPRALALLLARFVERFGLYPGVSR